MLAIERRQRIMDKLNEDDKVYVPALAALLSVTEETIRRDLDKLEAQGLLKRSHGGAVRAGSTSEDLSFLRRSAEGAPRKKRIAELAAPLIHDGDTIMMDSSTTGLALLQVLRERRDLTIITNSIRLTYDLAGTPFTVITMGGTLRHHSCSLTGAVTVETLARYYADLAIISCKALAADKGIMESNEAESLVKKAMIRQAKHTILLADATKFGKTAFMHTCAFDRIHTIVTDEKPDDSFFDACKDLPLNMIFP